MCKRPPCTTTTARTADAVGIVAIVVIALAIIGTVGPVVAAISHVVVDVIKLAAIGIGSGAMVAAVIWLTVHILRALPSSRPVQRIYLTARQEATRLTTVSKPVSERRCLACGDKGHVIRVIGNSTALQVRPCPECQPAQLTR